MSSWVHERFHARARAHLMLNMYYAWMELKGKTKRKEATTPKQTSIYMEGWDQKERHTVSTQK
jgi:hypothetical protein